MPDVAKNIGEGAVPTTQANVYTVPASTTTVVKTIRVSNPTDNIITVTCIARGRTLFKVDVPRKGGVTDSDHVLVAAQTIAMVASAAGLEYVISGVEITA